MADPLIKFLAPRIVLISNEHSFGTGFFITQHQILTCAHVVRDALVNQTPIYAQYWTQDEKGDVQFIKEVAHKVLITEMKDGEEYPDVAVLEITSNFPHGIFLLPEVKEEILYTRDVEYIAFGYQKQSVHSGQNIPQTVSLNYEGEEDANGNRKIIFENGLVQPGMSGAPLVERLGVRITGIVHMTRDDVADLGAYTIPSEAVLKAIRHLDEKLFSTLQSSDHRKAVLKTYRKDYPQFPLIQKYWKNLLAFSLVMFFALLWFLPISVSCKNLTSSSSSRHHSIIAQTFGDWLGVEVDAARNKVRNKTAAFLFNWWFLMGLIVIVGGLWLFITSVWILGSPENPELKLTLYNDKKLDSGRITHLDNNHQAYFLVPMFPFQKEIILKPEGREQVTINIQTGKRNTLHYPFDFKLEPVLFMRFNNDLILFDNYESYILEITMLKNNLKERYDALSRTGALLVGNRDIEKTPAFIEEVRQDLSGMEATLQQAVLDTISNFQHPSSLNLDRGDSIRVSLFDKTDSSLFFRKKIIIKNDLTLILVNPLDTI
ncbi:MAG: trypsin-like peptidase domain-containing protein [Saprospiraceae bacterium]|uniref:Trypsin-like peptidase domain-containing protein n=1 Tax=Candidatus Opimibacter skivensis TaxID=2982028 RepID=A0A9D7SWP9_9BACT|nr:trypsin-like peptidase domain-containing protein [Candidatus Opimibacter skivensis]